MTKVVEERVGSPSYATVASTVPASSDTVSIEDALKTCATLLNMIAVRMSQVMQPSSTGVLRVDASAGTVTSNVTLQGFSSTANYGSAALQQVMWSPLRQQIATS